MVRLGIGSLNFGDSSLRFSPGWFNNRGSEVFGDKSLSGRPIAARPEDVIQPLNQSRRHLSWLDVLQLWDHKYQICSRIFVEANSEMESNATLREGQSSPQ